MAVAQGLMVADLQLAYYQHIRDECNDTWYAGKDTKLVIIHKYNRTLQLRVDARGDVAHRGAVYS